MWCSVGLNTVPYTWRLFQLSSMLFASTPRCMVMLQGSPTRAQ